MPIDSKNYKAKNNLNSSKELFESRTLYKATAFSKDTELNFIGDRVYDTWLGEQNLYGRVDTFFDSVKVNKSNLNNISIENNKNIFVLNFVADAYKDMNFFHNKKIYSGRINSENAPIIYNLKPEKAYTPINSKYNAHITNLFNLFHLFLNSKKKERTIKSIFDYKIEFINFIKNLENKFPITLSCYILSSDCSILDTGLAFDIANMDASDDQPKLDMFVKTHEFEYFKSLTVKFGFTVDKNIPWRIIADLSSPKMWSYISNYGIQQGEVQELFNTFYSKTFHDDYLILKNAFIANYKKYRNDLVRYKSINNKNKIITNYNSQEKFKKLNDNDFFEVFIEILLIESPYSISNIDLNKILNNTIKINNSFNLLRSINYMYTSLHNKNITENSINYKIYKINLNSKKDVLDDFSESVKLRFGKSRGIY